MKTIVTVDLQLYDKCMRMTNNPVLETIRLGELHIVFAMLKVLGKYITDSVLNDIFIETEIFGPTTLVKQ